MLSEGVGEMNDWLISSALAQEGAAQATGGLLSFLPLIVIFVVFYFLLMRPQIKRAKEHRKMVEAMAKGDEVVTSGGIAGRVHKVEETFLVLEIADGVRVRMQKNAVASLLPKGTLKESDNKGSSD
jgi:preprotein translocase subunit YajC